MPLGAIGQESLKWFWMQLATENITIIETQIKEPSNLMDYWDRISSRSPLTHGYHALEVALMFDFES
jgi:hypothetical protein